MAIVNYLFLLSLILLPFGELTRLQLPHNINITLFDVSVYLVSLSWFVSVLLGKRSYQKYTLSKPLLLFFLTILISLAANAFRYNLADFSIAILYAVRFSLYGFTYFVVTGFSQNFKEKIPYYLTGSGVVLLLIGGVQYVYYSNLRNLYYLGWDDHLYRLFSSLLDPNFTAAFLVLYLVLLLGLLIAQFQKGDELKRKNRWVVPLLSTLALITLAEIFLTTSRSGLIMLVVSVFVMLVCIGRKKWIISLFVLIAVVFVFASRFFYLENVNPFRIASTEARVETARNALQIIGKNVILGVGFNSYRYAQYEYGYRTPNTKYPNHADSGTDNSFLFVFATTGIIGFVAYLYLLTEIYGLGLKRRKETVMGIVLLASLLGLSVDSLFINSLFYPFLLFLFFLFAGLTERS